MRILFLTFYYPPHVGASGRIVQELASFLGRKNTILVVAANLATKWLKSFERGASPVIRTPRFALPPALGAVLVFPLFIFFALRNRREFDIIVAQHHSFHFTSVAASISGRILKRPVVVRSEDVMRSMGVRVPFHLRIVGLVTEFLGTRGTTFTVVCSEQLDALRRRLNGRSSNVIVHPNFAPQIDRRRSAGLISQDTASPVIVFVGRMTQEYGLRILVRAIPSVVKCYPSVRLVLIGDGPEYRSLRVLVASMGLEQNVFFAGVCNQNEVEEWLDMANIGIGPLMPTRTLSRKILEYAFASLPIVVGENGVTSDFFPRETCKEVLPSPSSIAEALILLAGEAKLRVLLAHAAKERAQEFELEKVCLSFENILANALAPPT